MATKVSPRSRARVLAITALYQVDLLEKTIDEVIQDVRGGVSDEVESLYYLSKNERKASLDFFESLLKGTWEKREELDTRLSDNLDNWTLDRVGNLERAILRLGSYELLFCEDIPSKVTLNEMVELSKSFCDIKSKDFINGVLDAISP